MKKFSLILLFVSFFILVLSMFGLYYADKPIDKKVFYSDVNITGENIIGVNVGDESLTFGKVSKGGSATRNVIFQNDYGFDVVAYVYVDGEIEDFVYSEGIVEVKDGEVKKIPVNVFSTLEDETGFYSGNVTFDIYRNKA